MLRSSMRWLSSRSAATRKTHESGGNHVGNRISIRPSAFLTQAESQGLRASARHHGSDMLNRSTKRSPAWPRLASIMSTTRGMLPRSRARHWHRPCPSGPSRARPAGSCAGRRAMFRGIPLHQHAQRCLARRVYLPGAFVGRDASELGRHDRDDAACRHEVAQPFHRTRGCQRVGQHHGEEILSSTQSPAVTASMPGTILAPGRTG